MGLSLLQKVTPVKMKVLFIAATLALASAGFAPSCGECNAAAAGLLARLTSADSIAEQAGILISQVCPQAADAAACEAGLATGGATWQCASTPLSLEPEMPASNLVFARRRGACSVTGPATTAPTS